MMWANLRRGFNIGVPAPQDKSSRYWWYDRIAHWAHHWASVGITDVLFPSPHKTNAGAYPGSDGYGVFDDYDIGSKNTTQFGGTPTRFGYADQLRRAIAVCHANGLQIHLDHVMHQRMGGRAGIYRYLGADGRTLNGRFPKDPPCFRGAPPRVPEDPVPSPPDDFSFGDQLCPVNAQPKGYVWNGLLHAGDWLFRTLDADGARLDDMKGMNVGFMKAFMNSYAMRGKFFFGEYASGNRDDTNWWVDQVDGRASAIDFDFHYNMAQRMCNEAGNSTFYMGSLAGRGMIGNNPMKALPFVESMDSDVNGFATIVNNKVLGYALMLGGEGLPMVYARDYLEEPDGYGLQRYIDNLIWCHRQLSNGGTTPRYGDGKTYVFERNGPPGLLVALNADVWNPNWHNVTVHTNFGSGVRLHDYTGRNGGDAWTNQDGVVSIGIPPGGNGMGFGLWSRAGLSGPVWQESFATTQTFFGASDLDIGPLMDGQTLKVQRIWVEAGKPIAGHMHLDEWPSGGEVVVTLSDALGSWEDAHTTTEGDDRFNTKSPITGWLIMHVMPQGFAGKTLPFDLTMTYTAPKHLELQS